MGKFLPRSPNRARPELGRERSAARFVSTTRSGAASVHTAGEEGDSKRRRKSVSGSVAASVALGGSVAGDRGVGSTRKLAADAGNFAVADLLLGIGDKRTVNGAPRETLHIVFVFSLAPKDSRIVVRCMLGLAMYGALYYPCTDISGRLQRVSSVLVCSRLLRVILVP